MIYCMAYERQPCRDTICCRRCEQYEKCWRHKCHNSPEICRKIDIHYTKLKTELLQKLNGSETDEETV